MKSKQKRVPEIVYYNKAHATNPATKVELFNQFFQTSDLSLSLRLTLHIHRIIRLSFLAMQHITSALTGQVSFPYIITH